MSSKFSFTLRSIASLSAYFRYCRIIIPLMIAISEMDLIAFDIMS